MTKMLLARHGLIGINIFRFDYLLNVYERAKKKGLIEKVEPHTTSLMYALGDRLYQAYGQILKLQQKRILRCLRVTYYCNKEK